MRTLLLVLLVLLPLFSQIGPPTSGFTPVTSDPTGRTCQSNSVALQTPIGSVYTCKNGAYALLSGGGGGAGTIDLQSNGTPLGAIGTLNVVPGTGVISSPGISGATGSVQFSADVGYLATQLGINAVNAQTGTTYTIAVGDKSKLVTFSNAGAVAVTLPQGTGSFAAPFAFCVNNYGAGTATITPTTSTINNGASTLALTTGRGACIVTDPGGNYQLYALGGATGATGATGPAGPAPAGTGTVQVTSGVAGLVSGTSSNCVLVNGTSAPCDAPGQGAVSSVTPVTATNPSAASALQQLTLTAGLLNIAGNSGGTFNYQAAGIYTVASLQTPALTWTLHACAVSACASGTDRTLFSIVTPSVVTATNNIWIIRAKIANTATGASGTLFAHGTATIELTAASDLGTPSNDSNTTSTAAIDLTGVVYLQLYVTASSSNAGNTVINDQSSLEPASAIGPTGPAAVTNTTPGTSITLTSAIAQQFICTTTCTVTVPVPAQGAQYCVFNDDSLSTVITMAAIGSSVRYESTGRNGYGTAGTGTMVSSGAVGDAVCLVFRDSTHYLTTSYHGSWTVN